MNWQLINIVLYLAGFCLFICLQAIIINGVHECFHGKDWTDLTKGKMSQGNILYPVARWLRRRIKNEEILRPLFACIKCMASVWGAMTYWPVVIWLFGFHWSEVFIFIADMSALVYMNYYFYKKI